MTEAAAPIEHARPDPRPPLTPAQAAALQEACAAAAAIHSAIEFGVIARVTETPADPAAVAADCGPALFRPSAEHAAEQLVQPRLRVLDVGAGAAPWSLALAAHDPSCTITAIELPG